MLDPNLTVKGGCHWLWRWKVPQAEESRGLEILERPGNDPALESPEQPALLTPQFWPSEVTYLFLTGFTLTPPSATITDSRNE